MSEPVMSRSGEAADEAALRIALAQGDAALGTIGPVLGHLLANGDHSLFTDEIVSRVRGMVADLARQLLAAQARAAGEAEPPTLDDASCAPLTAALLADGRLVAHCHALAIEWQLTARLETRSAIDPVLSPLLQALIASDDPSTAATAMATLAAQARFVQRQRRMELPLEELPADHFHRALATWLDRTAASEGEAAGQAAAALREAYDESASRLGLLARLVHTMGAGALAALSIGHAGAAIFLTALAATSQCDRETAVLATSEGQATRLALSLRAAGAPPRTIEEQFLHIHPDIAPPAGLDDIGPSRAQALLGASRTAPGT